MEIIEHKKFIRTYRKQNIEIQIEIIKNLEYK